MFLKCLIALGIIMIAIGLWIIARHEVIGGLLCCLYGIFLVAFAWMTINHRRKMEEIAIFFSCLPRWPIWICAIHANDPLDEPRRPQIPETILTTVEDLTSDYE